MDKNQISKLKLSFDEISHFTDDGVEFWYARELQRVLEYTEWRNFSTVIEKAKIACSNSGIPLEGCFVDVNKTSPHSIKYVNERKVTSSYTKLCKGG